MKKFYLVLSIALSFLLMSSSFSQTIEKNKLTVTGKVKTYTKADRASVTFSIYGFGKSLSNAFDDARKQIGQISKKLSKIGLSDQNISTSFFNSRENYGDKAFLSSKKDYKVSMQVVISTTELSKLENIIVILNEAKVENIQDISFELIDIQLVKQDALKKAIEIAKAKANLFSSSLGINLKSVIKCSEIKTAASTPYYSNMSYNPFNSVYLDNSSEPISDGSIFSEEIGIESEVQIVFEIE